MTKIRDFSSIKLYSLSDLVEFDSLLVLPLLSRVLVSGFLISRSAASFVSSISFKMG